jgi:outer membrane biosynthesis protein TonB
MSSDSKPTGFNKKYSEEFLKRLDDRPTDRTSTIYQAIIFSLVLHVFFLFTTHQLTEDTSIASQEEFIPVELDMLAPEQVEQVQQLQEELIKRQGELKNVVANENSRYTDKVVNYRGMTQEQINEQVQNDLRNLEAEEFRKLQEGRPDMTVPTPGNTGKPSGQTTKPDPNAWYKDQGQKQSYSGNVSASYNVKGRDARQQPLPTYRCKSAGTVVIRVIIDQTGKVIETKVDETKSSVNECLRTESEYYAGMWTFDYNSSAAKKQDGTITFTFSAQ